MTPGGDGSRRASALKAPSAVRYVVVALLVPALLVALVDWLRTEYHHSERIRREAARSFDRRIDQLLVLSGLNEAETAQRDFLLTGDPHLLAVYAAARRDVRRHLRADATGSSLAFRADYLAQVERLVTREFATLDAGIAASRRGDMAAVRADVVANRGDQAAEVLRRLIERMIAAEATQLQGEGDSFVAYRAWLEWVVYAVAGTMILATLVFLLILWRLRHERHAALMAAIDAADRDAAILDSTSDAILILDPAGAIATVNAAASRLLDYPPGDLERRNVSAILDLAPGDATLADRIGATVRDARLPDRIARRRDGGPVPVDVAVGIMPTQTGDHLVVSLRDMAERQRAERVKDELISTVSHELRTPLTSIVGSLGLLRAGVVGPLPEQVGRLVEIAENNSHRLIRLINDMLDIDRIESGKLVLQRGAVDLRIVIAQACLGSQGLALASDVVLDCDEPEHAVTVDGDADRLLQVVTNLLSNAIHAAPAGSAVDVVLTQEDERATVSVEDRGSGIPAGFRDRIFGRFERASGHDGAGTGLGLAISRDIVVRHGGRIWFEDRAGGGTRFAFVVPLPAAAVVDREAVAVR